MDEITIKTHLSLESEWEDNGILLSALTLSADITFSSRHTLALVAKIPPTLHIVEREKNMYSQLYFTLNFFMFDVIE